MSDTHDILTKEDITLLVMEFYKKVTEDALLAPFFRDIDWNHHTPRIIEFWNMVLLGGTEFDGNPVASHYRLPLEPKHFERWLQLFHTTLDEYFTGVKVVEAKERSRNIALIFQYHMGILPRGNG